MEKLMHAASHIKPCGGVHECACSITQSNWVSGCIVVHASLHNKHTVQCACNFTWTHHRVSLHGSLHANKASCRLHCGLRNNNFGARVHGPAQQHIVVGVPEFARMHACACSCTLKRLCVNVLIAWKQSIVPFALRLAWQQLWCQCTWTRTTTYCRWRAWVCTHACMWMQLYIKAVMCQCACSQATARRNPYTGMLGCIISAKAAHAPPLLTLVTIRPSAAVAVPGFFNRTGGRGQSNALLSILRYPDLTHAEIGRDYTRFARTGLRPA